MRKIEYFISVGEPWDFEGPDGKNVITGNVLESVSNRCVIFQTTFALKFGDLAGNILVLTPRYKEDTFDKLPKYVVINGLLFLGKYTSEISESTLITNSELVINGGLNPA